MTARMKDVVQIEGGFRPSVQLPRDFENTVYNEHFARTYIPTRQTIEIFMDIRDSLQPNATKRARQFTGTYGMGKSDLMLMIANYVTRDPNDALLAPFFARMRNLDDSKTTAIIKARAGTPKYLLVLLQADSTNSFSGFVMAGLERALTNAGLGHLMVNTSYRAAREQIDTWERESPNTAKSVDEKLQEIHKCTLKQVAHDLITDQSDTALRNFKEALWEALRMHFSPTGGIKKPSEAYQEVARELARTGDYDGIFLICDEFTRLLEKLASAPEGGDIDALQMMIEAAQDPSQGNLHFYINSLEQYTAAQGAGSTQKYLEQIAGRLTHVTLKAQDTEELIDAAILNPENPFQSAMTQRDDLIVLGTKLWSGPGHGQTWVRETVVDGCFPLHPLTTYCLPRLNSVLAQNQRTMFRFIQDEKEGLQRFIDNTSAEPDTRGWITLYTVDQLYDYFRGNLGKRENLLVAYDYALKKAGEVVDAADLENGLAGRLLRAILLLEMIGGDPNLQMNADLLRHTVGLPASRASELTSVLSTLEDAGAIYHSQSGTYTLASQGRLAPQELRSLIEQRVPTLEGSPVDELNKAQPLAPIKALGYNQERGTGRELAARFITPAGLKSAATVRTAVPAGGGLLLYVLVSAHDNNDARTQATNLTQNETCLVVAVPREPTELLERFQLRRALQALKRDSKYAEYPELDDRGKMGADYYEHQQNALRVFNQPAKFDWFYKGELYTYSSSSDLEKLAAQLMFSLYPSTPPFKTQQINPTRANPSVKRVVTSILAGQPMVQIGKQSPENSVMLQGAGELGLIGNGKKDSAGTFEHFSVTEPPNDPRHALSRKVWDFIVGELGKGAVWGTIVNTLKYPPYGLYPSLINIYFAALYQVKGDYLDVYRCSKQGETTPTKLTADVIVEMVDYPERFEVRLQSLGDDQRKFLRELKRRVLVPLLSAKPPAEEATALRNHVAGLLRTWYQELPPIARTVTHEQLRLVLKEVRQASAATLATAEGLLDAASKGDDAETAYALQVDLPAQVGLSPNTTWTDAEINAAIYSLEQAAQELKSLPDTINTYVAGEIARRFGLSALPADWETVLPNEARQWRVLNAPDITASDVAGHLSAPALLTALDGSDTTFPRVFLGPLAGALLSNGAKSQKTHVWASLDESILYLNALDQAIAAVKDKAREHADIAAQNQNGNGPVPGPDDTTDSVVALTVDAAVSQIKAIFELVPSSSRPELLRLLQEAYQPQ